MSQLRLFSCPIIHRERRRTLALDRQQNPTEGHCASILSTEIMWNEPDTRWQRSNWIRTRDESRFWFHKTRVIPLLSSWSSTYLRYINGFSQSQTRSPVRCWMAVWEGHSVTHLTVDLQLGWHKVHTFEKTAFFIIFFLGSVLVRVFVGVAVRLDACMCVCACMCYIDFIG